MSFQTPILFIVFNRPDQTSIVFDEIKKIKPANLFVAADGPRDERIGESILCTKTRDIFKKIDWECNVQYLFSDTNLGCKLAVSSAINWFFSLNEMGIILEDDCRPNRSFFLFCHELLQKYRYNEKVMHIGGTNFQKRRPSNSYSYYFSNLVHIWGWATWRRAWTLYNIDLPDFNSTILENIFSTNKFPKSSYSYWLNAYDSIKNKSINTWDYQWVFAIWKANGISIIPNVNLVSNIGFGQNGTHTTSVVNKYADMLQLELEPIIHPNEIEIDKVSDLYVFNTWYRKKNIFDRVLNKLNLFK